MKAKKFIRTAAIASGILILPLAYINCSGAGFKAQEVGLSSSSALEPPVNNPPGDNSPAEPSTPMPDPPSQPTEEKIIGYGRNTTGGEGGDECIVANLNDAGAGSLRQCLNNNARRIIKFSVSGTIALNSPLVVRSNTTIDGRGQKVTITRYGFRLHQINNVIIRNLTLLNGVGDLNDQNLNNDAIQIWRGSTNIWLDRITAASFPDELIDISHASTDITISNCRLYDVGQGNGYAFLIGSSNDHTDDVAIRVTLYNSVFLDHDDRQPHLRFGRVHAFNNYFRNWRFRAMTAVMNGQIYSEANIYEAGNANKTDSIVTVTSQFAPQPGFAKSVGDLLLNGAGFRGTNGNDNVFNPAQAYDYTVEPANMALRTKLLAEAGAQ